MIMRRGRKDLSLHFIRQAVDASGLSDAQKEYAQNRLELAAQFIDDDASLRSFLRPGRMIIVDLRDEFIEKDQALGLFVVMLNIFAGAKQEGGEPFNKLIVFDEAHKYITHSDLTSHVVEVIRQMRHQGVTMLMASQDPPSLPNAVIELSSAIILHRFNSPAWLKHIQKSVAALNDLTPTMLASLQPGEAYIWANKATHPDWTKKAIKVKTRPRVTMHGGSTHKAIE
jgi:DNA helicase HerA-like ATPase